jgi:hypothetical protein
LRRSSFLRLLSFTRNASLHNVGWVYHLPIYTQEQRHFEYFFKNNA